MGCHGPSCLAVHTDDSWIGGDSADKGEKNAASLCCFHSLDLEVWHGGDKLNLHCSASVCSVTFLASSLQLCLFTFVNICRMACRAQIPHQPIHSILKKT